MKSFRNAVYQHRLLDNGGSGSYAEEQRRANQQRQIVVAGYVTTCFKCGQKVNRGIAVGVYRPGERTRHRHKVCPQ